MRKAAIISWGKTPFGAFPDRDLRSLAVESINACLHSSGMEADRIEAFYLGNFAGPSFTGQSHLAPYIAAAAGLSGIPCTRIEAACASGGSAFFHAVSAVQAGIYDVALVTGAEKMTSQTTARVTEILAMAGDAGLEAAAGATFPAMFAMIARRHMHQYGTTKEHLAAIAVKNHANGVLNPHAHMRKIITLEQAMGARPIAEPLHLYDCSLVSDGAASVLIASVDVARRYAEAPVMVRGIAQTSDYVALQDKRDITEFSAVQSAACLAYKQAGFGPRDIEVAEVHDCFTIAEIVAIEDLGFVAKGYGGPYSAEGCTSRSGERPVNNSGGLKSKGHPVGATGVAQICDIAEQLRGNYRIGLAQNLGGSGASAVVTILAAAS